MTLEDTQDKGLRTAVLAPLRLGRKATDPLSAPRPKVRAPGQAGGTQDSRELKAGRKSCTTVFILWPVFLFQVQGWQQQRGEARQVSVGRRAWAARSSAGRGRDRAGLAVSLRPALSSSGNSVTSRSPRCLVSKWK